jgi:uncharacterized membrane protein
MDIPFIQRIPISLEWHITTRMKRVSLYLMSLLYIVAGVNHFINPTIYQKIMPPYIPWHLQLVYISGVCEIAFAVLLLFNKTRRAGAWCIIALLVAIYPANIQMTVNYYQTHNPNYWLSILRLPLQAVLIYWAYTFIKKPVLQK